MKRTILVPTDFSEESLGLVEHIIANAGNDQVDIVLTHCMFLSDSIMELLFFSKIELLHSLKSPEFKKACRAIHRRCSKTNILIRTELFTGFTQAAFDHFIEGNQINEAVIPNRYNPRLNLSRSFNPIPFIRKSRLKITEVAIEDESNEDTKMHLIRLKKRFIRA